MHEAWLPDWMVSLWAALSVLLPGNDEFVKEVIKALLVTLILGLLGWLASRIIRALYRFYVRIVGNGRAQQQLKRALDAVQSDRGLWLTTPVTQPENYEFRLKHSIPIVTLGNLKGGVGKTTITANLAGGLVDNDEKILLIDLDFQGSLSSMMLADTAAARRPVGDQLSPASLALLGRSSAEWLLGQAQASPLHPKLFTLPTFYDLARTENRLMLEWLLNASPRDMRYFLAELLLHPSVQDRYDRILIDAPPRLSAACIQALCASTHVLIPTVMDRLSTEAVTTFINEVEGLRKSGICPCIRHLGVVGSMMPAGNVNLPTGIVALLERTIDLTQSQARLLPKSHWINDIPAVSRAAGVTIGILDGSASDRRSIKDQFQPLIDYIAKAAPLRN